MSALVKLLRPRHWVKNLLVLTPLVLSQQWASVPAMVVTLAVWCLLASGVYVLNDLMDIEKDRTHPLKKERPLAAGSISVKQAWFIALLLLAIGLSSAFWFSIEGGLLLSGYLVLNWLYSVHLKKERFLDILLLASFYLLRIISGGVIGGIELTPWFIATSVCIFLALAVHKRKMECDVMGEGQLHGRAYHAVDSQFLHTLSLILAFSAVIFLNLHSILVLELSRAYEIVPLNLISFYILLKYFDHSKDRVDDPVEKLLKSAPLLIAAALFAAYYVFLISTR